MANDTLTDVPGFKVGHVTNEIAATIEVGPAPQQIAFALKGTAGPNAYVTVTGLNKIVVVNATSPTLSIRDEKISMSSSIMSLINFEY